MGSVPSYIYTCTTSVLAQVTPLSFTLRDSYENVETVLFMF